ncbi:MAG: hypothetical protein ACYC1S_09055 [Gemmatimonadaceae bacterium]
MSPILSLLQSIGQALPPGSTFYVFAAELPDGRTMVAGPSAAGVVALDAQVPEPAPRPTAGPEARVAALRLVHGPDAPLKLGDRSKKLGISLRELRRAVKAGALPHEAKPDGRDNGAHTVTIGVMETYLKIINAVEAARRKLPPGGTMCADRAPPDSNSNNDTHAAELHQRSERYRPGGSTDKYVKQLVSMMKPSHRDLIRVPTPDQVRALLDSFEPAPVKPWKERPEATEPHERG